MFPPGAAARVRPSFARSVLHQTNLPPVNVRTVQLVNGPLHVRVGPKLNHTLVCAFLMGVCIRHLSCLTHEVLWTHKFKQLFILIQQSATVNQTKEKQWSGLCPNMYLEVLPTAAAGQVLHDETVLRTDWRSILIPARAAPAAVTATFKNNSTWKKLETIKMAKTQSTTGLGYQVNTRQ